MDKNKNIEEILKAMSTESIPKDVEQIAAQTSESFTRALQLLASERSRARIWADWLVDSFRKLAIGALAATAVIMLLYFATTGTEPVVWADVVAAMERIEQVHVTMLANDPRSSDVSKRVTLDYYYKAPDTWRAHGLELVEFIRADETKVFDPNQGKFVEAGSVKYKPLPEFIAKVVRERDSVLDGFLVSLFGQNVPPAEAVQANASLGDADIEIFDYIHDATQRWSRIWVTRKTRLPIRAKVFDPESYEIILAVFDYADPQTEEFFDPGAFHVKAGGLSKGKAQPYYHIGQQMVAAQPGAIKRPSAANQVYKAKTRSVLKGHIPREELSRYYANHPLEVGQIEVRVGSQLDGVTICQIQGLEEYKLMQVGTSAPRLAKLYADSQGTGRFRFEGDFGDTFIQCDVISRGKVSTQEQVQLVLSRVGLEVVEAEDVCTVWTAEYNGQELKPEDKIKCPVAKGAPGTPGALSAAYMFKIKDVLRFLAQHQDIVVEDNTGIDREKILTLVIPDFRGAKGAELAEVWYKDNFGITFRKEQRLMPIWVLREIR